MESRDLKPNLSHGDGQKNKQTKNTFDVQFLTIFSLPLAQSCLDYTKRLPVCKWYAVTLN